MAGNPRVEELRKRLEREPGSRLFAQYAEELRRAGDLDEAVRVCRDGLTRHPGYPSARITLGRALLDLGSVDEAATEFAAVLEAAPENLSASRYLGECLEKRGETAGALKRYQAALLHSPGDEWMRSRVAALAGGGEGLAVAPGAGPARPGAGASGTPRKGPPPLPGAVAPRIPPAASEISRTETSRTREAETLRPTSSSGVARVANDDFRPIPLVPVDDEGFELEAAHEVFAAVTGAAHQGREESGRAVDAAPTSRATPAPTPAPTVAPPITVAGEEEEFDLETNAPPAPPAGPRELTFRPLPMDEERLGGSAARVPLAGELPPIRVLGPVGGAPELASGTLADLYLKQGAVERAVAIYEELVRAEPRNQAHAEALARARARLESGPEDRKARVARVVRRLEAAVASIERARPSGARG